MLELFITFFKLGLFTIGGGVAMIPILQNIAVNEKKWFTAEEALDVISSPVLLQLTWQHTWDSSERVCLDPLFRLWGLYFLLLS